MTLREAIYEKIPLGISADFQMKSIEEILEQLDTLYKSPNDILPDTKHWDLLPKSGDDITITVDTTVLIENMSDNLKELLFCIKYHKSLMERIGENIANEKIRRGKTSKYRYMKRIQQDKREQELKSTRRKLVKALKNKGHPATNGAEIPQK